MIRGFHMTFPTNTFIREFTQIEQLITLGNYKKAFPLVETLEQWEYIPPTDYPFFLLLKSCLRMGMGFIEEGLKLAKAALNESQKSQFHILTVDALIVITEAMGWLGRFDKGLKIIKHMNHATRNNFMGSCLNTKFIRQLGLNRSKQR